MGKIRWYLSIFCASCGLAGLEAQVTLNSSPSRVVGHSRLEFSTYGPNLVEGRELFLPQGVAVDTSLSPPALYVSDTANNRVLGWKDAAGFANGATADVVIGQKDMCTTFPQGPGVPGSTASVGLFSPTGIVALNGSLYVADSGNNRVLRFPNPLAQTTQFPDLVIGQPNFNSRAPTYGGAPSEKNLLLSTSTSQIFRTSMAFDSSGNLYIVDPGNNRVLRYRAADLSPGNNGPAADLVLGQPNFSSSGPAPFKSRDDYVRLKDQMSMPSALAIDSKGRLYVSDLPTTNEGRVLVFVPPLRTGLAASRVMGVVPKPTPTPLDSENRTRLLDPEGLAILAGDRVAVVDPRGSRILIFDAFDQWPAETADTPSPQATGIIGQANDYTTQRATPLVNHGQPEPSSGTLAAPTAALYVPSRNELFVADSGNNRVLVFPGTSSFPAASRVLGQNDFPFDSPNLIEGREFQFMSDAGIAVDQNSNPPHLYVADIFNNRILGFNDVRKVRPGDKADLVIGQPDMFRSLCNYPDNDPNKPRNNNLCLPAGVAVDPDGNLWVTDSGNGRVLRFRQPFAQQPMLPQADLVLGQPNFFTKITDPTASTMGVPYGIAMDPDGRLLVSDGAFNRVLVFDKISTLTSGIAATKVLGQTRFTDTASGTGDGQMNAPHHIATDSDGRLYVADTRNNRVLIFRPTQQVSSGSQAALILSNAGTPNGVYVSRQTGEIWVADTGNARSLRFRKFDDLIQNDQPTATIAAPARPLAIAQDQFGALYVADSSNRVSINYPGLTAVNAANFLPNRPLAPGQIAAIYPLGNQFGTDSQSFTDLPNPLPLPTSMLDLQVTLNGIVAPLFYVGPGQINFQVPSGAPTSGTPELLVFRKSTGQIMGSGLIQMAEASPGLFLAPTSTRTFDGKTATQLAAVNQDGTTNSAATPAPRNSVITLFGTGQGVVDGAPPDGEPAQSATPTGVKPRIFIESREVPAENVEYSGLAPTLVGVWQINVRIPDFVLPCDARGGCPQLQVLFKDIPARDPQKLTTFAVKQ